MRGTRAKQLRKALGLKKPTPLDGGGLFTHENRLYFKRASNPQMQVYRMFKRRYKRGEL